jgi:hypothetical protein
LFREFLRTEFSEENIEFWIVCEEYRSLRPSKMSERAQEIYNDFVAVQAPREVSIEVQFLCFHHSLKVCP